MTEPLILIGGIDGGGSNTRAVVLSADGRIKGAGFAGSSTFGVVSHQQTQDSIRLALAQAFTEAGLRQRPLDALYIGLGGVINDHEKRSMRQLVGMLDMVRDDRLEIDNDIKPALTGGLAGQAGLVLLVGTGSVCFGIDRYGHEWRAGGWGETIDDPGSGYYLGKSALAATARAYDGRGPHSPLTTCVYGKMALGNINEIVWRLSQMDRKDIAAYAKIVMSYAHDHDEVAMRIVREGILELVLMVETVARKLDFSAVDIPLTTTGGVFKAGSFFKNLLFEKIVEHVPSVTFVAPRFSPVIGSVILAGRILGLNLPMDHLSDLVSCITVKERL